MALLYGQGDFRRTVQIGTLSGWESDNPTATMGGLLGLLLGRQAVANAFPGARLSDGFDISRTRLDMPDYLPADPAAEDTFEMLPARMLAIIDRCVVDAGGTADLNADSWTIPLSAAAPLGQSPTERLYERSANHWVRARGGTVTTSTSVTGQPNDALSDLAVLADGAEHDFSGIDTAIDRSPIYSTQHRDAVSGEIQSLTVRYSVPVEVDAIRFIEGDHRTTGAGGWFESIQIAVRMRDCSIVTDTSLMVERTFGR
jgi:hypothetical protein